MPVSSLIVRTAIDQTQNVAQAVRQLAHTTVEAVANDNIVVVTETENQNEDKQLWDQMERIPGVVQCDLIYHNFEEEYSHE